MLKNLFIFNFKILARILLRIILFLLFLEGLLTLGGWVSLMVQNSYDQQIAGSYRILCLGDSVTARGGEFAYPHLLQNSLNKAQSAIRFQVINNGRIGWSSTEMSEHFDEFLKVHHPDMVIIMLGLTDQLNFFKLVPVNQKTRFKFLIFDRIKVYRLIKRILKDGLISLNNDFKKNITTDNKFAHDSALPPTVLDIRSPTRFSILVQNYWNIVRYHPLTIRNYNDMVDLALSKGIRVVVMQYPLDSIEPLRKIIYNKNKVIFIDNEKVFKDHVKKDGYEKYFIDQDGHLAPDGAVLLVSRMTNNILNEINKINKETVSKMGTWHHNYL